MVVIERYDNGSIIRKYRDEMDEYRQKGEAFVFAVDPNSDDDSDNEASISEQSQESKDGPGDAEEGGDDDGVETQIDIVRGSASDEDDSNVRGLGSSCLNHLFIEFMPNSLRYIGCRTTEA
ncbi:hypothetical protein DVH24_022136 [Malus domestica]|uniref:Uncharacterized protein n=1 Tax=Malus domestica TaxID=3750 RepID=A0A498IZA4_MALDO|nr:hypothetical protein DVH24_022136 [Malus domestica]